MITYSSLTSRIAKLILNALMVEKSSSNSNMLLGGFVGYASSTCWIRLELKLFAFIVRHGGFTDSLICGSVGSSLTGVSLSTANTSNILKKAYALWLDCHVYRVVVFLRSG